MTSTKVITRFAPSPTGYLHIGGARTALFNWLYAKHTGGKMLLRIEDTDSVRSTQDAVNAILDGLNWLGITWDDDPIYQSSRIDRHKAIANQLLLNGAAYRCYCSKRQVDAVRKKCQMNGQPFRHCCTCRDGIGVPSQSNGDCVIRLRCPKDGKTIFHDQIKGKQVTHNQDLDDFAILRSDGTPTYMLAVVVDDHDMGITHIIRGDDHLTNASKQVLLYQALGWKVPIMVHVPLIHGMDGQKLSKRHGATGVDAYRGMGYLPQAILNYLVRLGWSHGNDEIISLDDMIRWFDLHHLGKSSSRFDFRKLNHLDGHYIRTVDNQLLFSHWKTCLDNRKDNDASMILTWLYFPDNIKTMLQALPSLKQRAKVLTDLNDMGSYLWRQRPLDVNSKAVQTLNQDNAKAILRALIDDCLLHCDDDWTHDALQDSIVAFTKQHGWQVKQVALPLQAALTGRNVSHGIYNVLVDLGRDESILRIQDQLSIDVKKAY